MLEVVLYIQIKDLEYCYKMLDRNCSATMWQLAPSAYRYDELIYFHWKWSERPDKCNDTDVSER